MKALLFIWIATCALASAHGGPSIAPVLVQVFNKDRSPVAGATVTIDAGLDKALKQEINPNAEFKILGKKAPQTAKTNALGHALVYAGGRWGPVADELVNILQGKVEVTAPGYEKSVVNFKRELQYLPNGPTQLTLQISVTLEREK